MRVLHKKNNSLGFTLFELLVAIGVVALMFGVVTSQVGDWLDTKIKETTNRLSSTIRYLHDKASTQNMYIRLVFDFEKNGYWVEATTERFLLMEKEVKSAKELEQETEDKQKQKEAEKEKAAAKPETDTSESSEDGSAQTVEKYKEPEFTGVEEFLLKPVTLPDGIFLKDIYTQHDKGPVSLGQAYIYFFPNGYIEPAIINLKDEKDEINYSIQINPLSGKTDLEEGYRRLEK